MEQIFLKYGLPGACLIALGWYIIRKENHHQKERKEWRELQETMFNRTNTISDETNKIIRENTNILVGLKTLLENRR